MIIIWFLYGLEYMCCGCQTPLVKVGLAVHGLGCRSFGGLAGLEVKCVRFGLGLRL